MPEQLAFTMLEVTDPYYYQKSRVNANKRIALDKHVNSEGGRSQVKRVFNIYQEHPNGLTDKEISHLMEFETGIRCNPSTVSARRKEIMLGKFKDYTIVPFIVNNDPLKRDGGQVNCLKRKNNP